MDTASATFKRPHHPRPSFGKPLSGLTEQHFEREKTALLLEKIAFRIFLASKTSLDSLHEDLGDLSKRNEKVFQALPICSISDSGSSTGPSFELKKGRSCNDILKALRMRLRKIRTPKEIEKALIRAAVEASGETRTWKLHYNQMVAYGYLKTVKNPVSESDDFPKAMTAHSQLVERARTFALRDSTDNQRTPRQRKSLPSRRALSVEGRDDESAQIRALERQLLTFRQRLRKAEKGVDESEKTVERLTAENSHLKKALHGLSEEQRLLFATSDRLQRLITEKEQELQKLRLTATTQPTTPDKMLTAIRKDTQIEDLVLKLERVTAERSRTEDELGGELESARIQLESERSSKQAAIDRAKEEIKVELRDEYTAAQKRLVTQHNETKRQLIAKEAEVARMRDELDQRRQEKEDFRLQLPVRSDDISTPSSRDWYGIAGMGLVAFSAGIAVRNLIPWRYWNVWSRK